VRRNPLETKPAAARGFSGPPKTVEKGGWPSKLGKEEEP
jgi:hypothetical protein